MFIGMGRFNKCQQCNFWCFFSIKAPGLQIVMKWSHFANFFYFLPVQQFFLKFCLINNPWHSIVPTKVKRNNAVCLNHTLHGSFISSVQRKKNSAVQANAFTGQLIYMTTKKELWNSARSQCLTLLQSFSIQTKLKLV